MIASAIVEPRCAGSLALPISWPPPQSLVGTASNGLARSRDEAVMVSLLENRGVAFRSPGRVVKQPRGED